MENNKNLTALYHCLAVLIIASCGSLIAMGLNSIISSVFGIDNQLLTRIINGILVAMPVAIYFKFKVFPK